MLMLLGILSILQVAFLPGFLLVIAIRIGRGWLEIALLSFASSLILNYIVVVLLVTMGLYQPWVVRGLFGMELLALGVIGWRQRWLTSPNRTASRNCPVPGDSQVASDWLSRLPIVASIAVIAYFASFLLREWGTIFTSWDAAVSWNKWALAWADNRFPVPTMHYPQLLPTNISLTYLLIGDVRIQFFAKWVMACFPLAILLTQFELARRLQVRCYYWGVAITGWYLLALLGPDLTSGYADVPAAFLSFVPYYLLLTCQEENTGTRNRVLAGAFLASGGLLTKQSGIFPTLAYPLLVAMVLRQSAPKPNRAKGMRLAVVSGLIILALVLPWLIFKEIEIQRGRDMNELAYNVASEIHSGRTLWERIQFGLASLSQSFAPLPAAILLWGLLGSLGNRIWRAVFCMLILPGFLAWCLVSSYDLRNLAPVVPLAAVATAVGWGQWIRWAVDHRRLRLPIACLAATLLFFVISQLPVYYDQWQSFRVNAARPAVDSIFISMTAIAYLVSRRCASWKQLLVFVILPYAVVWSQFGAYGRLDWFVFAPLAGIVAGTQESRWKQFCDFGALAPGILIAGTVVAASLVTLAVVLTLPDRALIERQDRLQREIVQPDINKVLYEFQMRHGFDGKVLTHYLALEYLPGLGQWYRYDPLEDGPSIEGQIARGNVRYILALEIVIKRRPALRQFLESGVRAGTLQRCIVGPQFQLFKIVGTIGQPRDA
jgi:hypothetical protein